MTAPTKNRLLSATLLSAVLLTPPLLAVFYAGSALFGLPFPPFVLFEWLVRVLPGSLLTAGIEGLTAALPALGLSVSESAKAVEQGLAVIVCAIALLIAAVVWARVAPPGWRAGLVLGAVAGLPLALLDLLASGTPAGAAWVAALFLGWGVLAAWAGQRIVKPAHDAEVAVDPADRRRFLVRLGGAAAAVTVAGAGLGRVLSREDSEPRSVSVWLPERSVEPVPGTRPEYTLPEDHYYIDINMLPPSIDGEAWRLGVEGLVENPRTLTLADFYEERFGEPRDEIITLSCISNRVGGPLIGTTRWTGVPLRRILEDAGVQGEARTVRISSADNYYEVLPLDLVMSDERIMLTYHWDGRPLNVGHGFPLRIFVPNRYGMKQPKWIVRIELTADEDDPGYWGKRGWEPEAEVKATSVIDTVAVDSRYERGGRTLVPVGGIAYAGDRGISAVQVRVDGGAWVDARLREPLSGLAWVIWRYDWPFEPGEHVFEVRCRDGQGEQQIEEPGKTHPSGATGLHRFDHDG